MSTPYAGATSGMKARAETIKILRRLGCSHVGFMDGEQGEVLLQFTHRARNYHLPASAQGWASMWLRENPWTSRRRVTLTDYKQQALGQGQVAVNSVLRDMAKGMATAIETGTLSFENAFLPWMLTNDGRTVIERIAETKLLPAPEEPKVVALPAKKQDGDH